MVKEKLTQAKNWAVTNKYRMLAAAGTVAPVLAVTAHAEGEVSNAIYTVEIGKAFKDGMGNIVSAIGNVVSDILPLGLTIVGIICAVSFGVKFVKRLSK